MYERKEKIERSKAIYFSMRLIAYIAFIVVALWSAINFLSAPEKIVVAKAERSWPKNYELVVKDADSKEFDVVAWYKENGKDIVLGRVLKHRSLFEAICDRVGLKECAYAVAIPVLESDGFIKKNGKVLKGNHKEKCFFQVQPDTVVDVEKRFGVAIKDLSNIWDCAYAGIGAFKIRLDEFGGDFSLAYVGYNRGPGKVRDAKKAGKDPRETSSYDDKALYVNSQILKM